MPAVRIKVNKPEGENMIFKKRKQNEKKWYNKEKNI